MVNMILLTLVVVAIIFAVGAWTIAKRLKELYRLLSGQNDGGITTKMKNSGDGMDKLHQYVKDKLDYAKQQSEEADKKLRRQQERKSGKEVN